MYRKLRFYIAGLVPGFLIVFFILNQKGVSCSGYLPNSRVIAETLSKDFKYSTEFKSQMQTLQVSEKFLKDSIITKGEIDFDRSQARKQPCPEYVLQYPEKNPAYEIGYRKCKDSVTFTSLKKLK